MTIDKYKLKLTSPSAELAEELDRDKRTLVTCEVDIYAVEDQDNQDGTYNRVYKAKLNGTTIVKQGDNKPIIAKSKRTQSQKIRQALWTLDPEEEFYNIITDKMVANIEDLVEWLKDK